MKHTNEQLQDAMVLHVLAEAAQAGKGLTLEEIGERVAELCDEESLDALARLQEHTE